MKKIIVTLVIIAVLVAGKIIFFSGTEDQKPASKQGGAKPPLKVLGLVVQNENIENKLFVTGTILANEEVELVPETSGKISILHIKEGAIVQKGELLVKTNDADLQAALKKYIAQAQLAKDKETRQKKLLDINGVSREEYEAALNSLASINADIDFTRAQISKTEIRAPFTGAIGLKYVSVGSYVSPAVKIATIQQLDPVKIDFSIPEKYAALMQTGNTIRFNVEGNATTYEAKIIAIESGIDIATRTLKARAICANKEYKIIPGSFANIEIPLHQAEKSIMVPSEALVAVQKGYKIFVCRGDKAIEVKVTAGLRTADRVQILDGLQPGDTVITSGFMQIKNGSLVNIVEAK